MAVLIEAISVVVRVDAIRARYPGGWSAFRDAVPNGTLACDDELARVGFMTPDDARAFLDGLEARGLVFRRDGACVDCAVVDQRRGPTAPCAWLEYGHVVFDGHRVAAGRIKGSRSGRVFTPDGWTYEKSLSRDHGFTPTGDPDGDLEFLRHEGGLDVFRNRLTGKEVYVGRTSRPPGRDGQR